MCEKHRDGVTIRAVSGALDDDPGEIHPFGFAWTLQRHGHFGPGCQGDIVVKFNAGLPDMDGTG
jgi:hypothetical protein